MPSVASPSTDRAAFRAGDPGRSGAGPSRGGLAVLDDLAEDASALNARIQALLAHGM